MMFINKKRQQVIHIIKIINFISVVIMAYIPASASGQGYTITGNIRGLKDNTKFFLIRSENGDADTVKTITSKGGKFVFQGKLSEEGELHFIKLDTSGIPFSRDKNSWIRLFLENRLIEIVGDVQGWPNVEITGSESTALLEAIEKRVKAFDEQMKLSSDLKDSLYRNEVIYSYKTFLDSIVDRKSNQNASASILIFYKRGQLTEAEQIKLYEKFSDGVKNSFYGKRWSEERTRSKKRAKIKEGEIIPDLCFKLEDGEIENILTVVKDSKFTLIDFWASWCAPCLSEWPNLMNIYTSYNRKDFNIVGISVMDNELRWKQAMRKHRVAWNQGFDWNSSIAELFNFNSLPSYLLVDQNGRLVAYESTISSVASFGRKIRGKELINTLEKLIAEEKKVGK